MRHLQDQEKLVLRPMVSIMYAGTLSKYHNIGVLYRALRDAPGEARAQIGLDFYGDIATSDGYHEPYSQLMRLSEWGHPVVQVPRLQHSEVTERAAKADFYLIAGHNVSYEKGMVTTKIWDYINWVMAWDARIIALVPPDSEIAKIIRDTDTGDCYYDGQDLLLQSEILRLYKMRRAIYQRFLI